MTQACEACLRRAYLVAELAPIIAGLLDRPASRVGGLLALPDDELITGLGERGRRLAERHRATYDPAAARESLSQAGIVSTCRHLRGYPPLLRELADPPAVLFSTGPIGPATCGESRPGVAIVGARRASAYGLEVAHALGRNLGAAGVSVVSGLALGIDAAAHSGCLDGRGVPVGVLAGGPDVPYPRRNARLHERVRRAGVVISEMPPGSRAFRWSFPARNRIMAGLARLTVVVEARDPSGSLITADFARDLGRAVGAVPGQVTSHLADGTNGLLRDGAIPVTGAQDVLDELFGAGVRRPPQSEGPPEPEDPLLRAILDAVDRGCSTAGIARAASIPAGRARAALTRLESEGHLVRSGLGGYQRPLG